MDVFAVYKNKRSVIHNYWIYEKAFTISMSTEEKFSRPHTRPHHYYYPPRKEMKTLNGQKKKKTTNSNILCGGMRSLNSSKTSLAVLSCKEMKEIINMNKMTVKLRCLFSIIILLPNLAEVCYSGTIVLSIRCLVWTDGKD